MRVGMLKGINLTLFTLSLSGSYDED